MTMNAASFPHQGQILLPLAVHYDYEAELIERNIRNLAFSTTRGGRIESIRNDLGNAAYRFRSAARRRRWMDAAIERRADRSATTTL